MVPTILSNSTARVKYVVDTVGTYLYLPERNSFKYYRVQFK